MKTVEDILLDRLEPIVKRFLEGKAPLIELAEAVQLHLKFMRIIRGESEQ